MTIDDGGMSHCLIRKIDFIIVCFIVKRVSCREASSCVPMSRDSSDIEIQLECTCLKSIYKHMGRMNPNHQSGSMAGLDS
jgi:hypothetical protein